MVSIFTLDRFVSRKRPGFRVYEVGHTERMREMVASLGLRASAATSELRSTRRQVGMAVDDIADVIEWLREEGQYDKSDRLRTIAGRLARTQPDSAPDTTRQIAKGWR